MRRGEQEYKSATVEKEIAVESIVDCGSDFVDQISLIRFC